MSYKYFENKDCEFYPCHEMKEQNCLFCFCPLYLLECGGAFKMLEGKDGHKVKDCGDCKITHSKDGYDYVMKKLREKGV